VNDDRASFVGRVICLYLEDPDTPEVPSSADWDIAHDLYQRGVPLELVRLAFQLAFVRRRMSARTNQLPPIRSLAYFRAVAINLTPDEQNPTYVAYVSTLYDHLRSSPPCPSANPPAQNRAPQPESGECS
jgi:hypothetical protein